MTKGIQTNEKKIKIRLVVLIAGILLIFLLQASHAQEARQNVEQLEDLIVKEETDTVGFIRTPTQTVIEVDDFTSIGVPVTVDDVLKHHAIVDFRAASDLVPDDDTINLRGFSSNRFVAAIDGLTVQKTGGRKSSHIVDYALLPTFLIDTIEILPGPHSALYDAKSIGGVLNLVTKKPRRHETLKPDVKVTTGFRTYDTQHHNVTMEGSVDDFTYDIAYLKQKTHGYLRNHDADIDTVYGRLGYLLPSDGFITMSTSYTWADRDVPVKNPGTALDGTRDYDGSYPVMEDTSFQPWQEPSWDKQAYQYRLNIEQPSSIGLLSLGAYHSKEDRDRAYFIKEDDDIVWDSWVSNWWQQGGKLQDEIEWSEDHVTTVGVDLAQMYDDGISDDDSKTKRIGKKGAFLQHQWSIFPSLDLRLGLRYEDVKIWVDNWATDSTHISGRDPRISRNWNQLIPKSFVTWKMDDLAPWLRETSLSAGVSRIWHAPDYHGDYNPQGRPAGAWLDPEHGIGYDLVLIRRLWRDISLKANYSFYEIEDYIATNSSFDKYGHSRYGELAYSDYKINLDEMEREGLELELGGHLTDKLSFFLTYAWQDFENQGDEPAGEVAQDEQAENRLTAGLRYALFENTTLMLDYYYQDDEIIEVSEEIAEDVWDFYQIENPSYDVFDLGVQHTLVRNKGYIKDVVLSVYIKNLFDENYRETSAYPATDRTYGTSLSMRF